ncbi:MAG: LysR family transcriptional regulator [Verrucomicrobia bacterium]|nr:MAG: LysR family transcriptional regulator [Verrucomicrobiota bacterium]
MSEFADIDLYKLDLLRFVAECRSFTAAAERAGISQSALSRQIQAIEAQLGVSVLIRTTRSVKITEAGAILLRETEAIPNLLSGAIRRVREECGDARKRISVGLSSELSLAHTPGIFHSSVRSRFEAKIEVSQGSDSLLFERVRANGLDLAIVCESGQRLDQVEIMHRMEDRFVILAPSGNPPGEGASRSDLKTWAATQHWMIPPDGSTTRELIDGWAAKFGWKISPGMVLENFDLMIQFVALGMGVAFVPRRALSAFPRKYQIARVDVPGKMSRDLLAIRPRFSSTPDHVKEFLEGILFS